MITNDQIGALLIGFLGSAHCIGMCGGIASVMSLGSVSSPNRILTTLFYNIGRLLSYMLAGAIVGGAVSSAAGIVSDYAALNWLRLFSAFVMIVLALYIGKWWQGLLYVEKVGQHIWKHIAPLAQKLLPLPSAYYALPLGILWGWLPCGLVYSTLTWAAVSGGALNGATIMLFFGIGTLPSMLLVGFGASYVTRLKKSTFFRQIGALFLLGYGIYTAVEIIPLLG